MASPSFAADLARPPTYKAPIYVPQFSRSGFSGGYGWGKSNWTATSGAFTTGDFNVNGPFAGGTLGYNLQTGIWVWGLVGQD